MKDKLIGVFILLMGLIALGVGATELRESLATKAPAALTWPQFVAQKPKAGWLQVSGAQLDVTSALWVESKLGGEIGNIYVPARAKGGEMGDESPIEMLVKIDDPKIAATVRELKELDKGTDEAALKYVLTNADKLIIERPLVGTLADGFDTVDSSDKSAIQKAGVALASDFVILQEGATPDKGGRIFMIVVGLGLSLLGLFYVFLKKPAPPAPKTASGLPPLSR